MKKLLTFSDSVEDLRYRDVTTLGRHTMPRTRLRLALAAAGVLIAVVIAWFATERWLLPARDRERVGLALEAFSRTGPSAAEDLARLAKLSPGPDKDIKTFELLISADSIANEPSIKLGAYASLKLATQAGSARAHMLMGKALRNGKFGPPDLPGAVREFDAAHQKNRLALSAGDSAAYFLQAELTFAGLGTPADPSKADELGRQALVTTRADDGRALLEAAIEGREPFSAPVEAKLINEAVTRAMGAGNGSAYWQGVQVCRRDFKQRAQQTRVGNRTAEILDDEFYACKFQWLARAANSGVKEAYGDYGYSLLTVKGRVSDAVEWMAKGEKELDDDERMLLGFLMAGNGQFAMPRRQAGFRSMVELVAKHDNEPNPPASDSTVLRPKVGDLGYTLLLSDLHWVPPTAEGSLHIYAAIRALAEHTGTTKQAKRALALSEWSARTASAFDSSAVRDMARQLRGAAPDSHTATEAKSPLLLTKPASGQVNAAPAQTDREQQDRTGYVPGAPLSASGGLSQFTVDNTNGARDAVARLYLNGAMPAVRHFFIKRGEAFSADKLAPGTYVLRYRYMGSRKTFEADRAFLLEENRTDTGTRASDVKVTLYTVKDGNMTTKEVPPESF